MSVNFWKAVAIAAVVIASAASPSVVFATSRLARGSSKSRMTHGHSRSKMVHSQPHQSSFGSTPDKTAHDKK